MNELSVEQANTILHQEFEGLLYLYTTMCGTCAVAQKMLSVIEELIPEVEMVKINVNFFRELAEQLKIESVPCLLIFKQGRLQQKIYAFQSVPYLYDTIKKII